MSCGESCSDPRRVRAFFLRLCQGCLHEHQSQGANEGESSHGAFQFRDVCHLSIGHPGVEPLIAPRGPALRWGPTDSSLLAGPDTDRTSIIALFTED
jgi:hypothetical protein